MRVQTNKIIIDGLLLEHRYFPIRLSSVINKIIILGLVGMIVGHGGNKLIIWAEL